MQRLALLACVVFVLWLFVRDIKRREGVSPALWLVLIWAVIIGSRAVSTWFEVGREAGNEAEAYDQGNPLERNIYFFLLVSGITVLFRRGVRFGELIRSNRWLAIFCGYWLLSVLWADLPFVAFKRWVKDLGNLVMVLVILTEVNPTEAAKAVFARCAFLLIPVSVLFVRYFPDLGRAYHAPTGEMMFTGVATHKNTLGVLAMLSGLVLLWDLWSRWPPRFKRSALSQAIPELTVLAMALWLLFKSHSATSVACALIGAAILVLLQGPSLRSRLSQLQLYGIGIGLLYWFLNSFLHLNKLVIEDLLGRDMTLTTRTEVWPVLLNHSESAIFGAGFMSYWSGDRLAMLYEEYSIIQAHNGYLEVFLNGGWIAVLLLLMVLLTANYRIMGEVRAGMELPVIQFMFLVIAVIHNFTEASISKGGLIWFALLFAVARYPGIAAVPVAATPPGSWWLQTTDPEHASSRIPIASLLSSFRKPSHEPDDLPEPVLASFAI